MMDRRQFFRNMSRLLMAIWGVSILYPIFRYLKKPQEQENENAEIIVCGVKELQPGESKAFHLGSRPGLLIYDKEKKYHAFDATCTHLGCTVQFQSNKDDIFCACHGGIYDLEGKNVSGPPPKPLTAYRVLVKNEKIIVARA